MLIEFLTDVMTKMYEFRDDITMVYLFEESPGRVVATGNHPKKLLFYQVAPEANLSAEIQAPAYLGALPYLRAITSASLMKEDPQIELQYRKRNDKKVSVESMRFIAKRFESRFQCTNPDILNDKDRVRQFPRPADAIFFPVTKPMSKEFDEVSRFGTPKADVRLFTLAYDGNYVRAQFGAGTHSSTLVLSGEVTGTVGNSFSKLISLDRFRLMLKLASDNANAKAAFHPNAVWVDFNTPQALHSVVSPTIREQVRS